MKLNDIMEAVIATSKEPGVAFIAAAMREAIAKCEDEAAVTRLIVELRGLPERYVKVSEMVAASLAPVEETLRKYREGGE